MATQELVVPDRCRLLYPCMVFSLAPALLRSGGVSVNDKKLSIIYRVSTDGLVETLTCAGRRRRSCGKYPEETVERRGSARARHPAPARSPRAASDRRAGRSLRFGAPHGAGAALLRTTRASPTACPASPPSACSTGDEVIDRRRYAHQFGKAQRFALFPLQPFLDVLQLRPFAQVTIVAPLGLGGRANSPWSRVTIASTDSSPSDPSASEKVAP